MHSIDTGWLRRRVVALICHKGNGYIYNMYRFSRFFLTGAIFFVIFPTFTHYLCIFVPKNARFGALACNKDARLFIKTHLYEKTSTYVGINHIGIIDSQCADRLRVAQGAARACRFGQRDD